MLRSCVCALALVSTTLFAVPASAASLPDDVSKDVNSSLTLLAQTYYDPVDQQTLLDAARNALIDAAHKRGLRISVAPLRASDDLGETFQGLDKEIADAAEAAHASPTDFAYAAIGAMAKAVDDKYTTFMTPADYKAFKDQLDPEKISGIGVLINADATTGMIALTYVVPGTPADRAGLQEGDVISAIDGTSTKGMAVEAASKLLRGKAGTVVRLTTVRGTAAPSETTIARSELEPPTVITKMLPGDIAYIYVIAFGQDTPEQFDAALRRSRDQGAKALVLDLRNDGGGYVESALEICKRFIAGRPLLTVKERGEPAQTVQADDDVLVTVPVTVLVNEYTASASEITAGALQDDGIAELVGTRTFGKGVMQTLTPLADGAAIKITTAHYLTPGMHDINLKGISPDMKIDENRDARFGDVAKDAQLQAAVNLLQKKIALASPR